MLSLKLILTGTLLFGGATQSFAEATRITVAGARKKIVHRAVKKAKVKAKKSEVVAERKEKREKVKKKIESSAMFPPDNH